LPGFAVPVQIEADHAIALRERGGDRVAARQIGVDAMHQHDRDACALFE
jgi:hypothetical protein